MDYKEKVIALLNSKELSKEQKEKLEDIFPELREPEDERIKSAAIEFVIQNKSFNYYLGISKDDVVTWINRQGEQEAWTEEDKKMLKWVIGYLENKMLNTPISEERTACKNAIAWFEEKLKGEQKTNPCDGCINRKGCINCENGELRETEQKPADKVEPKFKVGDWIVCCDYKPTQIIGIRTNVYELSNGDIRPFYMLDDNENIHLWTIQDAKDGDVLHCWIDGDEFILIYKGIKDGYITTYGHLYQKFKLFAEEPTTMFCRTIQGHFTPATKEQRDLLFAKMKEAGYMWDAEKKELKKIEQKPAAWNEEDARLLDNCISLIEDIDCTEEEQNWLKSLKDRVQLKQEWSEEDKTNIDSLLDVLYRIKKGKDPQATTRLIEQHINFIKSLKERYAWKPSDEQIKALETTLYTNMSRNDERYSVLSEFVTELKKLKSYESKVQRS